MADIVSFPLTTDSDRVRYGGLGNVAYRDTVNGVQYLAHWRDGAGWFVRYEGTRNDSDGTPVARSHIFLSRDEWNAAWNARATWSPIIRTR